MRIIEALISTFAKNKPTMKNDEQKGQAQNSDIDELDDIYLGFEIPDFDPGAFTIAAMDLEEIEPRYTKPNLRVVRQSHIMYENAVKLAKELRVDFGHRSNALLAGSFIFGDFIEAFFTTHQIKTAELTISTLSISQDNVDSLANLLNWGYVDKLSIVISAYFYYNEIRQLIPYIYKTLDIDDRFQLAVAGIHTKTCQFETTGGRKIIIHGSANLRSSGNIEQMVIEENPEFFDFMKAEMDIILNRYETIKKPIRNSELWNRVNVKSF